VLLSIGLNMAKLSDLISCASKVTGVPFATAQEVSRRLREGGLIQTGKGGRYGGADMAPEDAASLLTGLLVLKASSVSLSEIVRLTRFHLRELKAHRDNGNRHVLDTWDQPLALPQLCRLRKGHAFGESLSAFISSISKGELTNAVAEWTARRPHGVAPFFAFQVRVDGPRPHSAAQIRFNTAAFEMWLTYLRPLDRVVPVPPPRKTRDLLELKPRGFNLVVSADVDEETLTAIGTLLSDGDQ
jgi:hypothetical protein